MSLSVTTSEAASSMADSTITVAGREYLHRLDAAISSVGTGLVKTWDPAVIELVETIGVLFRTGIRRSVAQRILATQPSFWPFVRDVSVPETIKTVRSLPAQLTFFSKTKERENAWIICSLNHGDLRVYLAVIARNPKLVKTFYSTSAGTFLLDQDLLADLEVLLGRLDNTKFALSLEEYVQYLEDGGQELRSTLQAIPSKTAEEAKQLYTPKPIVAAHVGSLEQYVPEDMMSNEQFDDAETAASTEEARETKDVEKIALEADMEKPAYVSQFRNLINMKSEEPASLIELEATNATGTFNDQLTESSYNVSSLASTSPSTTSIPEEKLAYLERTADELQQVPALERVSPKRETLYGSPQLSKDSMNALADGLAEIKAIVEPKLPSVTVIEEPIHESPSFHPPIINTPSFGESEGGKTPTSVSLSQISDLGFFGIPLDGRFRGMLLPFDGIFSRFGRLILWVMTMNALSDDDLEESTDNYYTSELLQVPRAAKKRYQASEDFQYELRICPVAGLAAQNFACQECCQPLEEGDFQTSRLCDISGHYYCADCFGEEELESPARIINNWDFGKRTVAKQIAQKVKSHYSTTLINLREADEQLFERVPLLQEMENLRSRILIAMEYVEYCGSGIAERIFTKFTDRGHLLHTVELWSIQDLIDLHSKGLRSELEDTFDTLAKHIKRDCENCQLLGRYCEICKSPEPIYRFDTEVVECLQCNTLIHQNCTSDDGCINCQRVYMSIMSPSIEPAVVLD